MWYSPWGVTGTCQEAEYSHWERHSHKWSSSSRSSKGSSAGLGSSRSRSPAKSLQIVQLESVPPGTGLLWTKVQLELAHYGARLPRSESQLESVPPRAGLPRARFQLEPAPHGAGLPWTVQLELVSEGTGPPQTNTLDTVPLAAIRLRVGVQLEPVHLETALLRTRFQAMGLPPVASKVLPPWSPVELELALRAWLSPTVELRAGSQSLTTGDSQGAVSYRNQTSSDKSPATSSETKPGDPSPLGIEVTADTSPAVIGSLQIWQSPGGGGGTDRSGQDQTPSAHTVMATDGADTTDRGSSVNHTHGTAETSGAAGTDQADMVRVVSMATHTTGDTGSQSSQLAGPS